MTHVMISNGSFRSLTKCFISNVERFAFMKRTCLRTIWHINHVVRDNRSPCSLMCLSNVEILSVIRWTCLDYTRLMMNGFSRNGSRNRSLRSVWRTRFSRKELTLISWERDVFLSSCSPITSCVISSRPDLSRIGFRVGWFDWTLLDSCPTSARWAWSEPNFLSHSCFKEIFGGGRGDMYTFSYMTSPVSIQTTFGIQQAECVSWRMIAFDRVWWNVNPFLIARLMSTQYTASWCRFHALCGYCARRGTLKSIFSGSLWLLSIGSISRKNTVCLLLEFWPPGINPELMIECRLHAHPIW